MRFENEYISLVRKVALYGSTRETRVGGARAIFAQTITSNDLLDDNLPILTIRKMFYKPVFGELATLLKGGSTLKDFTENGCNYWKADAMRWLYQSNVPVAYEEDALGNITNVDLGPIYGAQWRSWSGLGIDQLEMLVEGLKKDPYGRRHVVSAWNVSQLPNMCLPPCHVMFQCYVDQNLLSIIVYMRSCDVMLGLPADMLLYSGLLALLSNATGYIPGNVTIFMADCHIYENHIPAVNALFGIDGGTPVTHNPPKYKLASGADVFNFTPEMISVEDYVSGPPVTFKLNT